MDQNLQDTVRKLIQDGLLEEAELLLLKEHHKDENDDGVYYWMGNLYRKYNKWKEALQYYARAIEINPDSPACDARQMLFEIVHFRDTQRYNVQRRRIEYKMRKNRGAITVDVERCKGCGLCTKACKDGLIVMSNKVVNHKGYPYAQQIDWESCNGCTACAIICPDGCITVYRKTEEL